MNLATKTKKILGVLRQEINNFQYLNKKILNSKRQFLKKIICY